MDSHESAPASKTARQGFDPQPTSDSSGHVESKLILSHRQQSGGGDLSRYDPRKRRPPHESVERTTDVSGYSDAHQGRPIDRTHSSNLIVNRG